MTDTDPQVAERYRAMLKALTPEERLRMTSDMWDMAKELCMATIDARTDSDVRVALFLRRYGHEFGATERQRIVSYLMRRERDGGE